MIGTALKKVGRFLASARFATVLLALVGAWSVVASFVPQTVVSKSAAAAWAAAHPLAESGAGFLGLHDAFAAPLFLVFVAALGLSTALCAWQRTKVAISRSRALRVAASVDEQALEARHDLEIACAPSLDESRILAIAAETLSGLGIRTKRQGRALVAVSPARGAWGSPVFHWALLALILTIPLGTLVRASGQMGVAVGQTKVDRADSYGLLTAGPLHSWGDSARSVRVDAFDPKFSSGGVLRGPTPTVSLLDAKGGVLATQRVFPNNTLKYGSLTIYPADYGLSADVVLLDTAGAEAGRSVQILDFSTEATEGTVPTKYLSIGDAAGKEALRVFVAVPLDRVASGLVARLPEQPRARVRVTDTSGSLLADRTLRPGEGLELPTGGSLRLGAVGYYARLQLVDDPSIPFLYAAMAVAMLGLAVATLARQQVVTAIVTGPADAAVLAVGLRLWRNHASSRGEIETELARALGAPLKEEAL